MKLNKIICATTLVLISSAAIIPVAAQAAQVGVNLIVGNAPPAPRYEVVPAPRRGQEWIPGYWNWNGRRHVWIGGHWERVHAGHYYQPAAWVQVDNGWRLERGSWQAGERRREERREERPNGDRDHDGVPNRLDRAPDNPRRN